MSSTLGYSQVKKFQSSDSIMVIPLLSQQSYCTSHNQYETVYHFHFYDIIIFYGTYYYQGEIFWGKILYEETPKF